MAMSMEEQRILDEMERKLAYDDPLLASRLTTFGHPGLAAVLRSPRARVMLSFAALLVIAVVSLVVYALSPFRGSADRQLQARPTPHGVTQPVASRSSTSGVTAPGARMP